ncbi:MAG: hypothetical protein AB7S78_03620 [Candidatus Omnitrophota bacterium]
MLVPYNIASQDSESITQKYRVTKEVKSRKAEPIHTTQPYIQITNTDFTIIIGKFILKRMVLGIHKCIIYNDYRR